MFRPNITAHFMKRSTTRDIFGKEAFGPLTPVRAGVVNLDVLMEASSVRADSSASRGSAQDLIAQAKILVPKASPVRVGDIMVLYEITIEITHRQPRINTRGMLDHYELVGKIRAEI